MTDGNGIPLANAPVRITASDCNGEWLSPVITYTDRYGEYQVDTDFQVVQIEGAISATGRSSSGLASAVAPDAGAPCHGRHPGSPAPTPPLMACRGPDGWVPR
ncbi:MAG: hypothetical protein R3F14_20855 [Polyangiaceae bacterium]